MGTKEECRLFFSRVFGLDLGDIELEAIWNHLNQNQVTPVSRHGGNVIAFTPAKLHEVIDLALEHTGSTLETPRFKKVREEILPGIAFTLLLKRLGYGEKLIVSGDVPDITLVDFDRNTPDLPRRRVGAIPIEAVFISGDDVRGAIGVSTAEKIASVIIAKKFDMRYVPQTILLASFIAPVKSSISAICLRPY
jgi:hypothetical protein